MHTLEKTAAGLLQSLLFGLGRNAIKEEPLIAENGAQIFAKNYPSLKRLLMGERPVDVLKQRLVQGGLAGKGGLIHGAMAYSPEVTEAAQRHGGIVKGLIKEPGNAIDAAGTTLGNALTFGLPAISAAKHLSNRDTTNAGRSVGEMAGWVAGMPFGLPGNLIANQMAGLGENAAKSYFKPELPKIDLPDAY